MTNKELEKMLFDYPKLKIEVSNLYIDLEEAKDIIGIYGESGAPRAGSHTYFFNSSVEREVMDRDANLQNKIECIQRLIRIKERQIQKVENAICLLDEQSIKFIQLRYWDKVRMDYIAIQYNLSKTALYKRRDKILEKVSSYLPQIIL